jgi:hypothetical protein
VVYRTARCELRVTRAQRNRLFGLLRSAGDVWCAVLELNEWRRRRHDPPLAAYRELCRELAVSGPGTFGELGGPHHGRPPTVPWPAPARPQRPPPNGESLATQRGARKPAD